MKKTLLAIALISSTSAFASMNRNTLGGGEVWITTDADAQDLITQHGATVLKNKSFAAYPNAAVAKVKESQLAAVSSHMHKDKHRCGGYMVHADKESAIKAASIPLSMSDFEKPVISHNDTVESLIAQ